MQAFVVTESVSDVSKRRNCVAHLSVYDGVQSSNASGEGASQSLEESKSAIFSGAGCHERLSMLTLMSIELLRNLDFTDTIEELVLAKARKTAIGNRPI